MERIVYSMTDITQTLFESIDQQEAVYLKKYIDSHIKQYQNFKKSYDPRTIAHNYHKMIDDMITLHKNKPENIFFKITCKKSCGYCCNLNVDITREEAVLITDCAIKENVRIDYKLLKRQSLLTKDHWIKQNKELRKCIFLDENNNCKIYEFRPNNCRKFLSIDSVEVCKQCYENKAEGFNRFTAPLVEALITAIMTATETNSMSKMLLEYRYVKKRK